MKLKKITGIISLLLCVMLLTACAGGQTNTSSASSAATGPTTSAPAASTAPAASAAAKTEASTAKAEAPIVSPAGELPIVSEKVELEIMMATSDVVLDYETNDMTKKMEEMTNIHINWKMIADAKESKSLLLASGDIPEIFGITMTASELVTYGEKGVFIDLTDLIDEYGYYINDFFAYDSNARKEITIPGNKIVSLPTYSRTYHMTACNKMWMNRAWLDTLGLKQPTTIDELYDVLVAFKQGDPNGNGTADEIPLTGIDIKSWQSVIPYLMSAYITTDNADGRFFVQPYDGAIDVVFNKPEWREGLMFINKLYTEGLIDAESFTQDGDLRKQKVESGIIGGTFSNAPSSFATADSDMFKLYDAVAPLKGPNGLQSTAYNVSGAGVAIGYFTITNKCKHPEAAFRWADLLYNEENNCEYLYGNEGVEWQYAEANEVGINGEPAIWKTLEAFKGTQQNVSWYQTLPTFRRAEWRLGEKAASEDKYYLRAGMETRLYDATKLYEPFYTNNIVPANIYVTEDKASEYSDIKTALYSYMYESTALFITGDKSLEKDWDSYLSELSKIGLEKYLTMTQEALDSGLSQ